MISCCLLMHSKNEKKKNNSSLHQYVQKSLETFFAPKLSRTTTITKKIYKLIFKCWKMLFFTTKHLLAQSTTETFQLTLPNLDSVYDFLWLYIPIYIFIYTNIHLYLYLFWKAKQKCWKKNPKYGWNFSLAICLSKSETKKQKNTNYHNKILL